jgi:hypothetical protein
MKPYEIYWGKDVQWGKHCDYQHMWIIVDTRDRPSNTAIYGCFPISSSCYYQDCYLIEESHPDFSATGLKHSSYILYTSIYELEAAELGKRQGELLGELLIDFRKESGV